MPPSTVVSGIVSVQREAGFTQFTCRDATAFAAVEAGRAYGEAQLLRLSCIWLNTVPSAAELEAARQLINRLYESLHEQLPEVPPRAASREQLLNPP